MINSKNKGTIKKVFNQAVKSKFIHEAILLVENTKGKAYYSDFNFDLLGAIIEKITKKSLPKVFEEFIFKPLKLKKTYQPTTENDVYPDIYYKDQVLKRAKLLIDLAPGGSAITTARELMIFIKGFFNGTLFDKVIFKRLAKYNKIKMGPMYYGGGYMQIPMNGIYTLFMGSGELIGHSGSTAPSPSIILKKIYISSAILIN